jgi:hypothetical protein
MPTFTATHTAWRAAKRWRSHERSETLRWRPVGARPNINIAKKQEILAE